MVLASLYEAAVTRDRWPEALQRFATLCGSRGALVVSADRDRLGLSHSPSLEATVAQFFEQGWHLNDYRTHQAVPLVDMGFICDQHIIGNDDQARAVYYDGFAESAGVPWFATGGMVLPNETGLGISLQRSAKEGAFSSTDLRRLNRILPRLREILLLAYRMGIEREASMLSGLALVNQAAVLFDGRALICGLNDAAQALVGSVFSTSGRKLSAVDRGQRVALAQCIDAACSPENLSTAAAPLTVRIEDCEGRPWVGQVAPITGRAQDIFGTAAALLILTPAYSRPRSVRRTLSIAFGLTPAEANVAELLAAGLNTTQIAERLQISGNAVRFHIKSILPKANVQRQAGFVAAAAMLLAQSCTMGSPNIANAH
jgi:DNA-binding CsgD family transcriptional regulator